MAVRIGHASTSNGALVNQVKISSYYSGGWYCVLRPSSKALAEKSANICEAGCNNPNIGYSQGSRNTLRDKALAKAGITGSAAEDFTNLAKVTVEHVNNISSTCYADCSSFMTFCAMCGGAPIKYGVWSDNAHVVSTMEEHFTANNTYVALKAAKYLDSSDYLRRGDILLCSGHTVMVLDDGPKAPSDDFVYTDISVVMIKTSLKEVSETSVKATVKLYKVENSEETELSDEKSIKLYNWKYELRLLKDSAKNAITDVLKVTKQTNTFTFSNLVPNEQYALIITAHEKDSDREYTSAMKVFTTKYSYPSAVEQLSVTYDNTYLNNLNKCSIKFVAPTTWGKNSLTKCYRLYLFVNGICLATNDSLIAVTDTEKTINLSTLDKDIKNKLNFGDSLQIGLQAGVKDSFGTFLTRPGTLNCSDILYLSNKKPKVYQVFIKIGKVFKHAVMHNQ